MRAGVELRLFFFEKTIKKFGKSLEIQNCFRTFNVLKPT